METKNILNGNIADLKIIHKLLKQHEELKNDIAVLDVEKNNLNKEIEGEEKLLQTTIETVINKRRMEVVAGFDSELAKSQDKLRSIRSDRKRAKKKGIEGRIKRETADLLQENKNIHNEIKTHFKKRNVITLCNSKLFYSLVYPESLSEKLIFLSNFLLWIFAFPFFAVKIGGVTGALKIIIYMGIVGIGVFLYGLMFRYGRKEHGEAFEETKIQRMVILKNKGKIKRIKRKIKRDRDEEYYNLSLFDDNIKNAEEHITEIVERKSRALNIFEKKTKGEIKEEIEKRDLGRIDELKEKLIDIGDRLREKEDQEKKIALVMSSEYAPYIGNENFNIEKIEKLIIIMDDSKVDTIGDALDVLKKVQ